MARKRTFETWSKSEQYKTLLNCIQFAAGEVADNASILNKFKDHKLFRLAAQHNKHVRHKDFEILKTITVFELVQNIISSELKES